MRSSNKYRVKLIGGARLITIYSGNGLKNFMMSNLYHAPALRGFHLHSFRLQITYIYFLLMDVSAKSLQRSPAVRFLYWSKTQLKIFLSLEKKNNYKKITFYLFEKKNIFFNFILCNFLVRTLQYFQKKFNNFFDPQNIKKLP